MDSVNTLVQALILAKCGTHMHVCPPFAEDASFRQSGSTLICHHCGVAFFDLEAERAERARAMAVEPS